MHSRLSSHKFPSGWSAGGAKRRSRSQVKDRDGLAVSPSFLLPLVQLSVSETSGDSHI